MLNLRPEARWSLFCVLLLLAGCRHVRFEDPRTVVMAIENSPTNLDPRVGTDAMSERIGGLLFDALVTKDEHFAMQPWLALSWEEPDERAGRNFWVFHLRDGVHFHDGRPLGAADAAWTINSLVNGSLLSSKAGAFANVSGAEARNRLTLIVRMKHPDASLLFNLSDGLFGVVPNGADKEFGQKPVGSGPFRFVSQQQDNEVVIERSAGYWAGAAKLDRVRFTVVPDAVTVALELQRGSVDIASNQLTLDLVHALAGRPGIGVERGPGSPVMYLNFNTTRGPLADAQVRQAVACAIDRAAIVHAVWRDQARLAATLLPQQHWAAAPAGALPRCDGDLDRARALLETAGYHADSMGQRLHLEMKISTDETTRLLAEILQQQLAGAGIALTLRASEFGTFYGDVTSGRFELYALRWIGSNEDPDIFHYAFGSDRFPPKGGNRGRYRNSRVDELLTTAALEENRERRRDDYVAVQQILAHDVPALPLWYPDNQVVHTIRVQGIVPRTDGSFAFLRDASIAQ